MNTKNLAAEFIGTFALIFIGAGALAIGEGGLVGVALAHGLVIVAFAYAYGHISGTHINPGSDAWSPNSRRNPIRGSHRLLDCSIPWRHFGGSCA